MDSLMLSSSRKKKKKNGIEMNLGLSSVPLQFYEKPHMHVIFVHKIMYYIIPEKLVEKLASECYAAIC